jgi:hypothetical protein
LKGDCAVTTIFCGRGSKLSHLKSRRRTDVLKDDQERGIGVRLPSRSTQVCSNRVPSPTAFDFATATPDASPNRKSVCPTLFLPEGPARSNAKCLTSAQRIWPFCPGRNTTNRSAERVFRAVRPRAPEFTAP